MTMRYSWVLKVGRVIALPFLLLSVQLRTLVICWLADLEVDTASMRAAETRSTLHVRNENFHGSTMINRRSRVHFRPFLGEFEHHNKTVTGETVPGPFLNGSLFLMGARISTSYDQTNEEVHVDVFGFPGDWLKEGERIQLCEKESFPKAYRNLITNEEFFARKTVLSCLLECNDGDRDPTNEPNACSTDPIPMTVIPLDSGDGNQERTTLIWRCDVSKDLTKSTLHQHAALDSGSSIRVGFVLQLLQEDGIHFEKYHVTTMDIPLHTAVVGHGGPQVRRKTEGYFHLQKHQQMDQASPLAVGHCLAIFGDEAQHYLREFVLHHKNIGISQIVVGMDATLDSELLHDVEKILRPFIDEGFVVLQATGLSSFFSCDSGITKLHFLHQCLYHFKGISKYAATWDLDEFWMPPAQLEVTGKSQFRHKVRGFEDHNDTLLDQRESASLRTQTKYITRSLPSAFSQLVRNDPVWQSSNYSKAISIQDAMKGVEMFYKQHGCEKQWCYHLNPSYIINKKEDVLGRNRIADDFDLRDSKSDWQSYIKGIARTDIAMMGGFHLPGSCKFPNDPYFYEYGQDKECYPHIWPSGEFGRMHHYKSLMSYRNEPVENDVDWVNDEYVVLFSKTVLKQFDSMPVQ